MIASNALSDVRSYIDGVLSGDIVTGSLIRQSVERHVADLERQSTEGFPYHFDNAAAELVIDYFPLCLKHSIGDYAGLPFELEPWQKTGLAIFLGWKRDHDNSRKYRRVYWSTGRKNGKSTFASGLSLYLASIDPNPNTGQPESVADVILCATKREQIEKVVFAEVKRMRQYSESIKNRSEVINKVLEFKHNSGTIRCIGSDRPYDGLNPSAVFKDEVHEFRKTHKKLLQSLDTGGGSRAQPLDIVTTTAGDDQCYIWLSIHKYFRDVTRGDITDESVFMWSYEIDPTDDPLDEANWVKANPNIGHSLKIEYLRDQATRAAADPIELNTFTRYHCNRCVSATESAFNLEQWDACKGELSDWREADCVSAGIDLGARDDLAAYALVARFATGEYREDETPIWRYEMIAHHYIAFDTRRDLTAKPFDKWVHEDLIRRRKFPLSDLRDDLIEDCHRHAVTDMAYDPYNGQIFAEEIEAEGIPIASMAQNPMMFHEPITDFRQAMADGRLTHDGNPVLRWCVRNCVIIRDRMDRWAFAKRDSNEKIDGAVAAVMAYRRAMVSPSRATGNLFIQ